MIKHWIKKHFLIFKIRNRFNAATQISQRHIFNYYRQLSKERKAIPLVETGFKIFSQFEEDGKLLYIFSVIGMANNTFIEIGSNDGINSNCANLYFNFSWKGLFIDADKRNIERGRYIYSKYPSTWHYPPKFIQAKVTRENINDLISKSGIDSNIGLLSIDIDGNDYWVWDAIDCVEPDCVVIESYVEFGAEDKVTPYNKDYMPTGKTPLNYGASPLAITNLAKKKGYNLVGANEYGFNLIFVKKELTCDLLPEVSLESVLNHPSIQENIKKIANECY